MLLALLLACARAPVAAPAEAAPPPKAEAEPPDFSGTAPVSGIGGAAVGQRLVAVRAAEHAGFDRVSLEFVGGIPSYTVGYSDAPVACGSGEPLALGAAATLVVSLRPAAAHDDAGKSALNPPQQAWNLPIAQRVSLGCDFEGVVELAVGTTARAPLRVFTLGDPPRLVIDLAGG